MSDAAQHKERLRSYFDGVGFERWSAIYGEQELSPIRRSIRDGHAAMLGCADSWIAERFPTPPAGAQALDAGCGTGLFTMALARRGFYVTAIDIAPQMTGAAHERLQAAGLADRATFRASDLEQVEGSFDLISCFDVLIHYPPSDFARLFGHLARMCRNVLLFTYAPYNPLLAAMHKIGGYFPHNHRRTEIQMIKSGFVQKTLAAAGMELRRSRRVSKGFYHVTLVEAVRVANGR